MASRNFQMLDHPFLMLFFAVLGLAFLEVSTLPNVFLARVVIFIVITGYVALNLSWIGFAKILYMRFPDGARRSSPYSSLAQGAIFLLMLSEIVLSGWLMFFVIYVQFFFW